METKKWRKFAAAVLAVVLCGSVVTIPASADDEDAIDTDTEITETEDSETGSKEKRSEAEEENEISAKALAAMEENTTVDGVTFYTRPEDYKDLSDDDVVKELKNAEIVGVDAETGDVLCVLEKEDKGKDFISYLSEKGRWLVLTDKDSGDVTTVRKIVSTLDNECLFLSPDGETLELYSEDYDEIVRTYTRAGNAKDGRVSYTNDDGWEVVLAETLDEVISSARYVCENDNLALYINDDTAVIGLYDKRTGETWWSTPESVGHDTSATNTIIDDLSSSLKMVYGEPAARSTTTQRSASDATIKVKDVTGGVKVTYSFGKPGISVPVTYTLQDDYLEARVETSDIEEASDSKIVTSLTIMGNFAAASSEDSGYFVIPDGSGALINFNNGKETAKSYTGYVYGNDVTAVSTTALATTQGVSFPMYGIVNGDRAMLVVADEGDANAKLLASVSGQSNSAFNTCGFEFILRDSDTYYMSGDNSTALTMFETGDIKTETIALRYYPLDTSGDDTVDYVDIADAYRDYLFENGVTDAEVDADPILSLNLYGGVKKEKSIAGIPIKMKTALTTYDQAVDILDTLQDNGVDAMSVQYYDWTNDGISEKIDIKAKPSGTLGGKDDWEELCAYTSRNGITLYPAVENETFYSGNGYGSYSSTAVRISGSYARVYEYDLAYGTQDTDSKAKSLLSPALYAETYDTLRENLLDADLTAASLGSLSNALYGDYGKQAMSRADSKTEIEAVYASYAEAGISLLGDTANAYVLPYLSEVVDIPLQSSQYDVFDEDIPFYSCVMHGLMPLSSTAVNAGATPDQEILLATAYGLNLHYDFVAEETSTLKDTSKESLYYATADAWLDNTAEAYRFSSDVLAGTCDRQITSCTQTGNVITTVYDDEITIVVDLDAGTATRDGKSYVLAEYYEGSAEE